MRKYFKDLAILVSLSILTTLLVWAPFFFGLKEFWQMKLPNDGMAAVVRNFDGPYYIVVAKSLYQASIIKQFEFDLPVEYYAAHYPLYPLLMKPLATFMGFPYAMLAVTVIFSALAVGIFYLLLKELKINSALWLSTIFLFLPARWFTVRSIGSPESLFIFLILLSIYGMIRKNYWLAGIAGAFAQLTKPPAILLFIAYGLYLFWKYLSLQDAISSNKTPRIQNISQNKDTNSLSTKTFDWEKIPWSAYPLLLIPFALIALFVWYGQIYGNIFAYFQSGDNIHLFWPPFQMFNTAATWVGTFWLEDLVWILLLGALGMTINWKRQDVISWFTGVFFLSILFVSHRDLARYTVPLAPFLIIAFAPFLRKKEFRIAFYIIVLPIYLYTINFIAGNTTPISDWTQLL